MDARNAQDVRGTLLGLTGLIDIVAQLPSRRPNQPANWKPASRDSPGAYSLPGLPGLPANPPPCPPSGRSQGGVQPWGPIVAPSCLCYHPLMASWRPAVLHPARPCPGCCPGPIIIIIIIINHHHPLLHDYPGTPPGPSFVLDQNNGEPDRHRRNPELVLVLRYRMGDASLYSWCPSPNCCAHCMRRWWYCIVKVPRLPLYPSRCT